MRLLTALLLGGVQSLRFLVQTPRDRLRAALQILARSQHEVAPLRSPLCSVGEGLYRIEPDFFAAGSAPSDDKPVVIYFTGTGESAHAPLPAYRALINASAGLSGCEHFVVEAPFSRGAYYGSAAFSSRMWERVQPLVESHAGPFVLVGLSRGAIAALEVGARISEEHGKVAAVLAMSAPLKLPARLPDSVVQIAALERAVERIAEVLPFVPRWVARLAEALVERVHLYLTAVLQVELGMLGAEDFRFAKHDVDVRGPIESSGRAVREFRLLVEAPDRELEHFAQRVAGVASRTVRFFAALTWGERDQWLPATSCAERLNAALSREQTPSDRVVSSIQPGIGHGLFRDHTGSHTESIVLLTRVLSEATTRAEAQRQQSLRSRHVEEKLRANESAPHPNEDG